MQFDDNETEPLNARGGKKVGAVNETQNDNSTISPDQDNEGDSRWSDEKKRKYIKWGLIGGVILIALVLAIVLPIVLAKKKPLPPPKPPVPPFDTGINYYKVTNLTENAYSMSGVLQYNESKQSASFIQQHVQSLFESTAVAKGKIGVNWKDTIVFGPNNKMSKNLKFSFDMIDQQVSRLTLTDNDSDRFSVPSEFVNRPESNVNMRLDMVGHTMVRRVTPQGNSFAFAFIDNTDDKNIFLTTEGQSLIFSDKYIQMDFQLPSSHCYGFGERQQQFELPEGAWGMWSNGFTDQSKLDDGLGRGGSFGVHPFLLVRTRNVQKYIGLYFRNSNAQLPILRYNTGGSGALGGATLSYIALGGQIEAYFFIAGTAKSVIQQYQRVFGKPYLPPFWSLGWQEATPQTYYDPTRQIEGDNQTTIINTIARYINESMPIETIYLDQKVYEQKTNFKLNKKLMTNITDLRLLETFIHIKMIGYLDPSIILPENVTYFDTENPFYVDGNAYDVFIKSSINPSSKYNSNLVGLKGLNKCVYIDWFNIERARTFWNQALEKYIMDVPFDGLWTQNNEATNDVQGEVNLTEKPKLEQERRILGASKDFFDTNWFTSTNNSKESTYSLPFTPLFNSTGPFDVNSVSLNATHHYYLNNQNGKTESEYNLHSLYGHAMVQHTHEILTQISKSNYTRLFDRRQFVVSRSSFTGTGQYASYALKSKYRTWASLQNAIPHLMTMNMMGFTHSGVDVCGLIGDKDDNRTAMNEELCLRWIQMATFFPLARHSQDFSPAHPYITSPLGFSDKDMKRSVQLSMRDRMQYLRFMYTCLFESSEFGGTCIDPLIFHFPIDLNARNNMNKSGVNDTFIFGGAVKVSPIVDSVKQGQKTYKSHFPKGKWVNLATLKVLEALTDDLQNLTISEATTVTKHLRPGFLIPFQDLNISGNFTDGPANDRVTQTEDLIKRPIDLIINRDSQGVAKGNVFLDSGSKASEITQKHYEYYTITHKNTKAIQFELTQGSRGYQDKLHSLGQIIIADAGDLESIDFACGYTEGGDIIELETDYSNKTNSLKIYVSPNSLDYPLKFSKLSNIFYGSSKNKDLNLCSQSHFEYMLDPAFDNETVFAAALQQPQASFKLIHKQKALPDLNLTIRVFDEGIMNVRWTWANTTNGTKRSHFEIPDVIVNTSRPSRGNDQIGRHIIIQKNPFLIQFTQQQGQTPVYFEIDRIIYDSYLNWVGMRAFTESKGDSFKGVMGLGERTQKSMFYADGVYSMWNYDQSSKLESGVPPGDQSYSTHPFFMWKHSANKWVGVFFKQAHAQDWIIENDKNLGVTQLKQVATGGISDIYVILNSNSPDSVVSYYHRIIGKPFLPPLWALGWHQSKKCLKTVEDYKSVIESYNKYRIPLDAQWGDADYMNQFRDFTVDFENFGNLTSYTRDFLKKKNNIKFVPVIDSGISIRYDDGYRTFSEGNKQNVFLKSADGKVFQGRSLSNEAAFVDFFHPNTSKWWDNELTQFHKEMMEFDGIWLDRNEPSNICNGACIENQRISNSMQDQFYYTPTGRSLETKSLPVDLKHANGYTQLDSHNYYGSHQAYATYNWFKSANQKRPFIIERSSFAGVGKYAGKSLGENTASYADMQNSVTGIMMMNVFGIPFSGADICGYGGITSKGKVDADLCARWHQVGSVQPFSRNNRDCEGPRQDPGAFADKRVKGTNFNYTDVMKSAILTKYSLMKYFYTQLFQLSRLETNVGTLYKPMFFAFPNEEAAYMANPAENVMIGPSLKLSIKTTPTNDTVGDTNDYYFPPGLWCDILHPQDNCVNTTGKQTEVELMAGTMDYQLHLREGEILPFQNASEIQANETRYAGVGLRAENLQEHPIDLHIVPRDATLNRSKAIVQTARGSFINDDGLNTQVGKDNYNEYSIVFTYNDEVNNNTNDEYIRLTVGLTNNATRYYSNETKCSSINMNDMLGKIFIYDEFGFFKHRVYVLGLLKIDSTFQELGIAKFDPETNRMVYDPNSVSNRNKDIPSSICLSDIEEIDFMPIPQ